ncbi:MAG: ATPase [Chloroflexi bacterium]|nr:ATPase [Chloroflexota bacterium]
MNPSHSHLDTTRGSHADAPIRKTIVVAASVERAFEVFTEEMSTWWPLSTSHIGKLDAKSAVIEPFVGGRWFERGVDGSECDWGRVRTWDPPRRLVLSWEISVDFQYDPSIQTEVEVRFTPEGTSTRVDLEHRLLHYYGDKAGRMRGIFDSEQGWGRMLGAFAARASEG